MYKAARIFVLGCVATGLAACGRNGSGATAEPLAYVPADAAIVIANLEPLTDEARNAMLSSGVDSGTRAKLLTQQADLLEARNKPNLANVYRELARVFMVKTPSEFDGTTGIDSKGHVAIYLLQWVPSLVMRGELSDAKVFQDFVARLQKAYGKPFIDGTLDGVKYQTIQDPKAGAEVLIATHDGQFVVALLPIKTDSKFLREVLGLDRPTQSLANTGRLKKLAEANGYGPYMVGYLDTSRVSTMLASGAAFMPSTAETSEPPGTPPVNRVATRLSPSCEKDFARITSRVPLFSFGLTKLEAKEFVEQFDIQLAPDIVEAFKGVGTQVPGLGASGVDGAFDLALALPIPAMRTFWSAQADAVAAQPFTCSMLTSLNQSFASLKNVLPKTFLPPFNGLRGLRVLIDKFPANMGGMSAGAPPQDLKFSVLLASANPTGLLDMAKGFIPGLAELQISDNGKPVALPQALTARFKLPGWLAVSPQAIAIGVGNGEDARLASLLKAAPGESGTLARYGMDGGQYAQWLDSLGDQITTMQANRAPSGPTSDAALTKARLEPIIQALKRIDSLDMGTVVTANGVRITVDVHRH